jgi:serine/threonine-protein phosphatase PGAM5
VSIRSSDWPRAVQTANAVGAKLDIMPTKHRLFREVPRKKRRGTAERIDRIVERFFKASRRTRHEVIVCHGNLIRSLVLRVTAGRADGWNRLMLNHGSITSFLVSRKGVIVMGVNLQAHLPISLRSNV